MSRKRYTPEEIIGLLREAEVRLSQGEKIGLICKGLAISEQSYCRWRREYGGLNVDQAKRLKDLEKENLRLRKAVSDLTLDKVNLNEALSGNY
jgi:putative transposase